MRYAVFSGITLISDCLRTYAKRRLPTFSFHVVLRSHNSTLDEGDWGYNNQA